jgi:hypothetical protein
LLSIGRTARSIRETLSWLLGLDLLLWVRRTARCIWEWLYRLFRPTASTPARSAAAGITVGGDTALLLTYASLFFLCLGVSQNFYARTTLGFFREGPYSLVETILKLYKSGNWPLASLVLLCSVFFPFAKTLLLWWIFNFREVASSKFLSRLAALGPWSMLDAMIMVMTAGAFGVASLGNMSVDAYIGLWCFMASIFLNAIAIRVSQRATDSL